jgi:20S proteasome subunit beta 1
MAMQQRQLGSQPKGYLDGSTPKTSGEHMMGTSIMAVKFNGGVVMGADSRTSTGTYVANRVSDKLSSVAERIYCCRSGSAADTQAISDIVRYYLSLHALELDARPRVATAAHLFKDMCYGNKDRLQAGIICAGWDDKKGGSVYSIPLGGTCVEQDFAIGGSGSTFIYGYCDAKFQPGMSKAQCQQFVQSALAHAMARDGSSGGVIRMVTIDATGVKRAYIPGNKIPLTKILK